MPTPFVGAVRLAYCQSGFPPVPEETFTVLRAPGMGNQAVLFQPASWGVVTLQAGVTAGSQRACDEILLRLRALRRTTQSVCDGVYTLNGVLICGAEAVAPAHYGGLIVGGLAAGDTWEMALRIHVLPSPSEE